MIFLTVGMERFPFDRMVKSVDEAVGRGEIPDDIFMQTGHTKYTPRNCPHEKFLSFRDMHDRINASDIIVSHAGIGSMLLCLHNGKIPILFPRRKKFNEHLDDHQMDISHCIQELCRAVVVFEEEDLVKTIHNYSEHYSRLVIEQDSREKRQLIAYLNNSASADKNPAVVSAST